MKRISGLLFFCLSYVALGQTNEPFIELSNAGVSQVLRLYSHLKARTVLQHPAIRADSISVTNASRSSSEHAAALEKALREHGITIVEDGPKFVLAIPSSLTNKITTHYTNSISLVLATSKQTELIGRGLVEFNNADINNVVRIYEELTGYKRIRSDPHPSQNILFRNETPLTRADVAYALETLIAWSGLRIHVTGEKEFELLWTRDAEK